MHLARSLGLAVSLLLIASPAGAAPTPPPAPEPKAEAPDQSKKAERLHRYIGWCEGRGGLVIVTDDKEGEIGFLCGQMKWSPMAPEERESKDRKP